MAIIRGSSPIDVDAWPSADQALFAAWRKTYPESGKPLLDSVLAFLAANDISQHEGAHIHITWTEPGSLLLGAKTLRVRSEADFAAQFQSWVDGRFERLTERGVFKGVKSINSLHGLKFGTMSFSVDVSFRAWPRRDVVVPVGDVKPEKVFTSESPGWSSRLGSQRG